MTTILSIQRDATRSLHRAAEGHQPRAAQHQPRNMAIGAVLRVFEAEAALETESAVFAATKTQPGRVYGLVDQLHSGGAASVATDQDRLFGCGA